jgi:uncharacterized LabA/DUF88 family protein
MAQKLRAGIYVDHSNIKCGGDNAGWQVDYKKLSQMLGEEYELTVRKFFTPSGTKLDDKTVTMYADKARLHQSLDDTGWELVTKDAKTLKRSGAAQGGTKCNLDCELIVEAMKDIGKWDVFIILSSDGDFAYLAEEMLRQGKQAIVFAWRRQAGAELFELRDKDLGLKIRLLDSRRTQDRIRSSEAPASRNGNGNGKSSSSSNGSSSRANGRGPAAVESGAGAKSQGWPGTHVLAARSDSGS